ncbi:Protein of unknown function [Dyella jiangningensis]|uniref:tail completion protein gp17 n=1 Tax=Dyella sp. AtDHG13 TaxID=1938897 RepID=UPI00088C637F|nr:DUF3168 domain-containing protein [Dyella sp. AtDHG13]PXV60661.1 uncharacterized protein DUF3168 [Dyella sp. AtDHG13]SDJ54176.1 Protein of unknown function [Dyella jiangningensis]
MSVEAQVFAALQGVAPTYPLIAPQGAGTPRITYLRVSGRQFETLANGGGAPRVRMQVDVWSDSYDQAEALAMQAKDALRAQLKVGEITDNPDEFESDTRLYRASFDAAIWP